MRPMIGLTTYGEQVRLGAGETYAAALPMSYVRSVQASGGRAVLITEDDPGVDVLDALDGIVFTGGADVAPARYGEERHERTYTREARDEAEMLLLREALERQLPVLAICRGMQLMAVAYGGRLHQHLPDVLGHENHRPSTGFGRHDVRFVPGSGCAALLGTRATVNSLHHQGVAGVGSLIATGWAVDDGTSSGDDFGLVEAVEDPSLPFAVGVQWHPEEPPGPDESPDRRLFVGLVAAASGASRDTAARIPASR